jgi:Flp pilus assembly protein TadG
MMLKMIDRVRQLLNRLGEGGAAAVEMAVVGPIFLLMFLGIFELGYMVFVQSVLDGCARDAARLIRTGQVAASANPLATFQNLLCTEMASIVGCSNLIYNVQPFATYGAVSLTPPKDSNGKLLPTFNPGGPVSNMLVEVIYIRPFFTQYVGQYLGGSSNSAMLTSTVIFHNEPFPNGATS